MMVRSLWSRLGAKLSDTSKTESSDVLLILQQRNDINRQSSDVFDHFCLLWRALARR